MRGRAPYGEACPAQVPHGHWKTTTFTDALRLLGMAGDRPEGEPMPWRDVDGRAITQHGFRRSFRSWVDDEHPADAAAAEVQLAHEEPNKVAAAYRGSDLLARRVVLMRAWAEHCMGVAADNVVPLGKAAAA
jgi:integrase